MDEIEETERLVLWLANKQLGEFQQKIGKKRLETKFRSARAAVLTAAEPSKTWLNCVPALGFDLAAASADSSSMSWFFIARAADKIGKISGNLLEPAEREAAGRLEFKRIFVQEFSDWYLDPVWQYCWLRDSDIGLDTVRLLSDVRTAVCAGDGSNRLLMYTQPRMSIVDCEFEIDVSLPDVCCPEQLDMKMAMDFPQTSALP